MYINSEKGQSFLFVIYKGEKNIEAHISIEDIAKFRGFISSRRDFSTLDFTFTKRFYDFEFKERRSMHRFYVMITFDEAVHLNIVVKTKITDARAIHTKTFNKHSLQTEHTKRRHFYDELLQEIEDIKVYEEGCEPPKEEFLKLKENKRTCSEYREFRARKMHFQNQETNLRILSARKTRQSSQEMTKVKKLLCVKRREVQFDLTQFIRKLKLKMKKQRLALVILFHFKLILGIASRFDNRVKDIKSLQKTAFELVSSNSSVHEWIKHKSLLQM